MVNYCTEIISFSLNQILSWFNLETGVLDVKLSGIEIDSRKIKKGYLFCAVPGCSTDGHNFILQAYEKGAAAILVAAPFNVDAIKNQVKVPVIVIPDLKKRLGQLIYYLQKKNPNRPIIIGVTGTNGKSSCCYYLSQILRGLGHACGISGTLGLGVYPDLKPQKITTLDVLSLHRFITQLSLSNVPYFAMEVSSHGLDQHRVSGIPFHTGIFTNLTQDHLDYHGTMKRYAEAKAVLFGYDTLRYALFNRDCDYYETIKKPLHPNVESLSYAVDHVKADLCVSNIKETRNGLSATLYSPWGVKELDVPLLGRFNLYNLMAVVGALVLNGHPLDSVIEGIKQLTCAPGRMQRLLTKRGEPEVIVDFAHTPAAIKSVLHSVKKHFIGWRVITVFGCGGDRDREKRPLMAEAAESESDILVITSDNPRSEDPNRIIEDIVSGLILKHRDDVEIIADRSKAIHKAIELSDSKTLVLILGKGHETYQEINNHRIDFCDMTHARNALKNFSGE